MEKLVIDNFLAIEHAEIEIKKINLFIGPQAQGKSLISKLIYFFKEYPQTLIEAVYRGMATKDGCDKLALTKFKKIFPEYTWENQKFIVSYSNKYYSVSIANRLVDNQNESSSQLLLELNSNFIIRDVFFHLKDARDQDPYLDSRFDIKKAIQNPLFFKGKNRNLNILLAESFSFLEAVLIDILFENNPKPYLERVFYIPAGRSFFANLDKSIFSYLSSEIKIDYFLTRFGKHYEQARQYIEKWPHKERTSSAIKKIIGGDFAFEEGKDWIINEKGKIDIADASSGQQEALPLVVLLSTEPYRRGSYIACHFIIEEPETHLFPVSQNEMVLLVANAYNYLKELSGKENLVMNGFNSFTIATHSPYILTAFNNLIQAGNVAASKNYEDLDELRNIVPESEWVDFNDVTAYVVDKGTVKPILNHELKLIHANMIDEVSNHLSEKFRKLLHMEVIDE